MAKNSNRAILYTVLAIAVAGLLVYLWQKHSTTIASTLARLQAAGISGSRTVPLSPSGVFSTSLVPPTDMSAPLTNTSGNDFFGSAPL